MVIKSQDLLQVVGLALLLVGAVQLWGSVALVVAGALMLIAPEAARVDVAGLAAGVAGAWRRQRERWATAYRVGRDAR